MTCRYKLWIIVFWSLLIFFVVTVQGADSAAEFYAKHPRLQQFFPFGVYGDIYCSPKQREGVDDAELNRLSCEILTLNGFNIVWGAGPLRQINMKTFSLTPYGKEYYGKIYPFYELKALPTFSRLGFRDDQPAFKEFFRNEPPLSAKELRIARQRLTQPLALARKLVENYPKTVMGFITDDEPHKVAPAVAAVKIMRESTGMFATFCKPTFSGVKEYIGSVQPMTGDWYVNGDPLQNSWIIQQHLRWLATNAPELIFYFLPLADAYGSHERIKTWLRDSRPSAADVRLQFWSSFGLGCKGYFYYRPGGGVTWAQQTEDTIYGPTFLPNNELGPELGRLAQSATTIGPLVLNARPDLNIKLKITCKSVRFPAFTGPAVDYAVMRDVRKNRLFVTFWNNNIYTSENFTATFSSKILKNSKLYSLAKLLPVRLSRSNTLALRLPPGGGAIFVLTASQDFPACKKIIKKHQVRPLRLAFKIGHKTAASWKIIDIAPADMLAQQAQTEYAKGDYTATIKAYKLALTTLKKAKDAVPLFTRSRTLLAQISRTIHDSDDLFMTHKSMLGIPRRMRIYHMVIPYHGKKIIAYPQICQWAEIRRDWLKMAIAFRAGQANIAVLESLYAKAQANQQAIKKVIAKVLKKRRMPYNIAFITPDRRDVEFNFTFSWLYDNANARWFTVDNDNGKLVDNEGNPFKPSDFQVVWFHQLRYAKPLHKGVRPAAQVLLPAMLAPPMVKQIKQFVDNGGGLLLTGIAGLYTLLLESEKITPNRLRENSFYHKQAFNLGLTPSTGYGGHPMFNGLSTKGFYTNSNFPGQNLVTACAWETIVPSGVVVANEYDETYGAIQEYAAAVEYRLGKGKIMVIGGRSFDLSPSSPLGLNPAGVDPDSLRAKQQKVSRFTLRNNVRKVLHNTLAYLAEKVRFSAPVRMVPQAGSQGIINAKIPLPIQGWKFKTDPRNQGMKQKWFAKKLKLSGWKPVSIGRNWEIQGYPGYNGYAWYRLTFPMRKLPGKQTILNFGAVDEEAIVFIDGQLAGKHQKGPKGWAKSFKINITRFLDSVEKPRLLTVQVYDTLAAGGIWKPIFITYE